MNKEEIKKLLQKVGLDTVGIAPIGPYEELRKILENYLIKLDNGI